MKRFLVVVAILFISNGCKSNQDIDKNCLTVTDIITSSECYDQTKGLTLTASNVPESSELIWSIHILKDTLGETPFSSQFYTTKSSSIVIPDSLINDYPFIDVGSVAIKNCSSRLYFRFARRVTSDSICTTWYLKEKGVSGD